MSQPLDPLYLPDDCVWECPDCERIYREDEWRTIHHARAGDSSVCPDCGCPDEPVEREEVA